MLYLLLTEIDPSTSISIESHWMNIEKYKLQDFNNNVPGMIVFIERNYKIIKDNSFDYVDKTYCHHVLSALSSGPNVEFNKYIDDIQCNIDAGHGYHCNITTSALFAGACTIYNNLDAHNKWTAVDTKDAQIMALTTEIEKLKQSFSLPPPLMNPSAHTTNKVLMDKIAGVEKWHRIKQGNTLTHH